MTFFMQKMLKNIVPNRLPSEILVYAFTLNMLLILEQILVKI
jgi:hypothetical protein